MTRRYNPSFVRRGNHFLNIEGKWVLIDGPWLSILENLRQGSWNPVHIPSLDPSIKVTSTKGGMPECNWHEVEWKPMCWHPGVWFRPSAVPLLSDKWNKVLTERKRVGYFMLPKGALPAFFNRQEYLEDVWWVDSLLNDGY